MAYASKDGSIYNTSSSSPGTTFNPVRFFPLLKGNENINENLLLKNHTDAIIINSDNYDILNKIAEHKDEYEGKEILFLGYIEGKNTNKSKGNRI